MLASVVTPTFGASVFFFFWLRDLCFFFFFFPPVSAFTGIQNQKLAFDFAFSSSFFPGRCWMQLQGESDMEEDVQKCMRNPPVTVRQSGIGDL